MVNRMVLKMCCNNICIHIICRMLDCGKFINLMFMRYYDNSTRMLACGSLYTRTSFRQTLHLTSSFMNISFFKIFVHITICCLFCKGTDGSCPECLSLSENNFYIFMRFWLIFSREIQVNIRLFISLKSKECLKWNIMSFLL